jgi:putative membrane-bound dehydrogenase-like protein
MFPIRAALLVLMAFSCVVHPATNANRLVHLDSDDPFYPGLHFPKLITPQWVGEEGVDAVVILSIDDMRETPKYEAMLRPILERLKKIDGRAAASIMVNTLPRTTNAAGAATYASPQIESWLKEGVSLECHTIAHPCPLCQNRDFNAAARTYHDCVDLMSSIPGRRPVAFRMPCCDSMNSPTPRFYSEIFNRTTARSNFLSIDSSVMVMLTTNDPALPRELVIDADGRERFRKYLPQQTNATTRVSMGSFTTTIEDYPYPYVIGKLAWEFPCIVPSDWEANNLHTPNNPKTVEDWKRALDAVVRKQGVMTIVFHPHGWIRATQMVEFVEYAASQYGKRVKFLNFREAQERLNRHLLAGRALRDVGGGDSGVRLLDVNGDGFMDVTFSDRPESRVWEPATRQWREMDSAPRNVSSVNFGVVRRGGNASAFSVGHGGVTAWHFDGSRWVADGALVQGLTLDTNGFLAGRDPGVRLRDIDRDRQCELLVSSPSQNAIFKWNDEEERWKRLPFALPEGTSIVDAQSRDAGLRFVDVDGDGFDDVLFSNHERYSLHLFRNDSRELRLRPGWTDEILSGKRGDPLSDPIPPIVRAGTNRNNGVWFSRGTMWIQNEDTAHLPDKVDRRTFKQWLTASQPRALAPEESLRAMRVRPGFVVELVASEPLIQSPVAFEWSADGRLWVVEMGDYPSGVDGKGKGGGRVRVLTDRDRDGRYDDATTFLEGLKFPTGIYPWGQGVVISAAPNVFYVEDQDNDGRGDMTHALLTGFVEGNQQHRVNGFEYGLDGWLYGANGDSGGTVKVVGQTGAGAKEIGDSRSSSLQGVNIRGRDFRFHPNRGLVEAIAGQTQFGRRRDDFGNWFGNNNPTWLWHYFFPEHYLARNPLLPVKTTKRMLANYPESTRCFPISRMLSRFNDAHAANHVTSGNSPTPYRDELFGEEFATSVFISEPVHNLVHREVLTADGVSFKSRRADDEMTNEFLASTDNWFRPTMLKTGPDGGLYIADMYRLVIEHPEWIPAEMQRRLDLRAGADMGRIYRVRPENAPLRRIPNLATASAEELVTALGSGNGWQRDTAQRLIIERKHHSASPMIARLANESANPKVRVQALWTLHGLNSLTAEGLLRAFQDKHPAVREHAIQLSEAMVRESGSSESMRTIADALIALRNDSSARVRFQLAFTLGEWKDERVPEVLAELAGDNDENIRNAALSSAAPHAPAMLAAVERRPQKDRARSTIPMLRKLALSAPAAAAVTRIVERTNVLSAAQRAERAGVLQRFAGVATLKGDARRGEPLFQQQCASCHRLRGAGTEVGPDLGMMIGKPVEQIIQGILDPNAAMEARYQSYTAVLRDGTEATGVIVAETPTTVTLRAPNRADQTVLRAELKELISGGVSLMPEGLEAAFTPQQLADLIAYITGR